MPSIASGIREGQPEQTVSPSSGATGGGLQRRLCNLRYGPWYVLAAGAVIASAIQITGPASENSPAPRATAARTTTYGPGAVPGRHLVAPQQLAASNALARREFGALTLQADEGRRLGWSDLSRGSPVVLVFIKEGCPCNAEVETYFARVAKLYDDVARFVGVIDGPVATARDYAERQQTPYPVFADLDLEVIHHFEARNGCYFALLNAGGVVDGLWPGCSPESLAALGRRIAALARVEERPVPVADVPAALITGCPFEERKSEKR